MECCYEGRGSDRAPNDAEIVADYDRMNDQLSKTALHP
jgi:hypothetical protein